MKAKIQRFGTMLMVGLSLVACLTLTEPRSVFAQFLNPPSSGTGTCLVNSDCAALGANATCSPAGTCVAGSTQGTGTGVFPNPTNSNTQPSSADQSSSGAQQFTPPASLSGDASKAFNPVMVWLMSIFAWLVAVAALTLDYAAYYTVVNMGLFIHSVSAIGTTWRILRDLGNIVFIFGFLAIGISTILGVDMYGWNKKMLPILLICAVFLNFSLFFAEAVIDVGNLFATEFYTQINGGVTPTAAALANTTTQNETISTAVMNQLGLQQLYGKVQNSGSASALLQNNNPTLIGFMGIILFITLAFVLFTLAFVLIARFVYLIFLILLAPIGIAGLAVPALSGRAKEWWSKLVEQTITAPVLFLMLYVALAIITDINFLKSFGYGSGGWTDIFEKNNYSGFAGTLLSFVIAMGLLLAVSMTAKSLSAYGAGFATKAAKVFSGVALARWAGGTVAKYGTGYGGRLLQSANNRMRSGRAGKWVGYGLSALTLGGLSDYNVQKTAQKMQQSKFGTGFSLADRTEFGKKRKTELSGIARTRQAKNEIDSAQQSLELAKADLARGNITQAEYDQQVAQQDQVIREQLSRMSTKELEELDGIKKGVESLVRNLSPEQFESLIKSDNIDDSGKQKMRAARYAALDTAVANGDKAAVRQWSTKDLAIAMPEILKDPAKAAKLVGLMSNDQFDSVVKNDRLSRNEQQQVKNFGANGVMENLLDIVSGNPPRNAALVTAGTIPASMVGNPLAALAEVTRRFNGLGPKKVAKLPAEILTSNSIVNMLSSKHLAAIMSDGDLDPGQIKKIAQAVKDPVHVNHAEIMNYLNPATNPVAASYWS